MFATNIPIRIDAKANHIVTDLILSQSVEDEVVTVRVEGSIEMNDDFCLWKYLFYCPIACIRQSGILLHIILRTTHRPEETVGGLVAYLNPTHIDTSVLDGLQNLTSMSSQRLTHLLIVHFLPRSRDVLLTRIGPPIAIVEVNHHDHSLLFSSFCHLDNIVLIT